MPLIDAIIPDRGISPFPLYPYSRALL
jgi:hypothetical protein